MTPQERLASYKPDPQHVQLLEENPWALVELLSDWQICMHEETANVFCPDYKVSPIPMESTDLIVLWCDLHNPGIDPLPLKRMTDFFLGLARPARHIYDAEAPRGIRTEYRIPPSQEVLEACVLDCDLAIERLRRVGLIRLDRAKSQTEPTGDRLPLLTQMQREALEYIKSDGPVQGKEIARRVGVEDETVRGWCCKQGPLAKHGVKNERTRGYFCRPM